MNLEGDLDTTMATMSDDPHLNHVPTMAGGVGQNGVRAFYRDHLVGKFFPPDVKMMNVSRTVGEDRVVDELFISFTHTTVIDWLLPGVAPTGKAVEMAVAVIVGFKGDKISHEHILLGSGRRARADRIAQPRRSAGDRRRKRAQGIEPEIAVPRLSVPVAATPGGAG